MREQAWLRTPLPNTGGHRRAGGTGHRARHGTPRDSFRSARRYRTLFISDVHLGTRGCKAELLADFLTRNSCETLFLIGDIVDGWRLKRRWYWPDAHNRVIHE